MLLLAYGLFVGIYSPRQWNSVFSFWHYSICMDGALFW